MIKFIEIQGKNEIHGGILDYLLKVVMKENDGFKAFLVNAKYFLTKETLTLSSDAILYNDEEKTYSDPIVLTEDEKDEIEDYFLEELETTPREKTTEEIREEFLRHVWGSKQFKKI